MKSNTALKIQTEDHQDQGLYDLLEQTEDHHYNLLAIDCEAYRQNYRFLQQKSNTSECSAVLKADGYGLGAIPIARALESAGCHSFFVAYLDEAISLRQAGIVGDIYALNGFLPRTEASFAAYNIIPTLCDLYQIEQWQRFCQSISSPLPAALHVDTGMTRTGLSTEEWQSIEQNPEKISSLSIKLFLSQMAYSTTPQEPFNLIQRERFIRACTLFPNAKKSLAKSATIFWGADYAFDLVRPGIALHGIQPNGAPVPQLTPTFSLWARIYQIQSIAPGQSVGYNQTYVHSRECSGRIATLCLGYADGFPWALANQGYVVIAGYEAPIVGRISMDLVTVDVSNIPESVVYPGAWAQCMGGPIAIEDMAARAGTVPYELLLRLGSRFHRCYY